MTTDPTKVVVSAAALKLALNALRRDAEEKGMIVRKEIADELEKSCEPFIVTNKGRA